MGGYLQHFGRCFVPRHSSVLGNGWEQEHRDTQDRKYDEGSICK